MPFVIDDGDVRILQGDALEQLATLPSESVHCIVTSPPFWALRDYGMDGQIGLEPTPEAWCARLVEVFRECRRVLRSDGVMWLEVGDTYTSGGRADDGPQNGKQQTNAGSLGRDRPPTPIGLKPKDLVGAPWMLAFALRADGWYLRSDTIWARPNPMPESVTDRPTKAHSYVFLLTKSARYFYDADAIRQDGPGDHTRNRAQEYDPGYPGGKAGHKGLKRRSVRPGVDTNGGGQGTGAMTYPIGSANARSVWSIATEPTPFAHFATFPQALVERCIKSGCPEGGTVLDPFMGSGTTALVARRLGRHAVGVELNPEYIAIAAKRLQQLSLLGEAV